MHWAPLMTDSPIKRLLLIVLCSLCSIYCTQFNSCSVLLIFIEVLPLYTSVQELNASQTFIFTNAIRGTTLFLSLNMKHTETLSQKYLLIWSTWSETLMMWFFGVSSIILNSSHPKCILTSEVAMSTQIKLQCFKSVFRKQIKKWWSYKIREA